MHARVVPISQEVLLLVRYMQESTPLMFATHAGQIRPVEMLPRQKAKKQLV